jgi:hypothetical protein
MTLEEAKSIIAETDPTLLVDERRSDVPHLLALYREGDTHRTNFDLRALDQHGLRDALVGLRV